ncbi:hypothetical protein V5799_011758 [Amblyomma americanum]|uniref:Secreted protein n=1 Tax=Amblyomma americanum TaxID=6943 RepID=A0AAQ4EFZ3_AMBAM
MKFRELETLSVALHLTAFVLLVDPRSSLDAILIDVATIHVIDLFPSGSTAKYPLLATLHFHPMTSCSSLTSGQCRYSNGTLPTCSLQQRSLEDSLAVEAYCLTPFIQAARIEEASLGPWVSEAAGGVCSSIAVAVLQMKFRELETLSVALHLTAFVLLVAPCSSRDVILIDVATMHVIDLFPSGSSAKYILPATLYLDVSAKLSPCFG